MQLSAIWRHPIKSHGAEPLQGVMLRAGKCLPFDREWAVVRTGSGADGSTWLPCGHFSRGSVCPELLAIGARLDEARERVVLSHPRRPDLELDPDADSAALVEWLAPLTGAGSAPPARLVRARAQPMTDTDYPSVSVMNLASLADLGAAAGQTLDMRRFRGNLWLDGLAPWAEEGLIGRELHIGDAVLAVREPIARCRATEASPQTGARDTETLALLRALRGEANFGVYAEVVAGGHVAPGAAVRLA